MAVIALQEKTFDLCGTVIKAISGGTSEGKLPKLLPREQENLKSADFTIVRALIWATNGSRSTESLPHQNKISNLSKSECFNFSECFGEQILET